MSRETVFLFVLRPSHPITQTVLALCTRLSSARHSVASGVFEGVHNPVNVFDTIER